jgi:hypothetical protein
MWKAFWDGLNIRKAMALLVAASYVTYIFITGQDLGLKDITIMVVSYYFGYANGQKMGPEVK